MNLSTYLEIFAGGPGSGPTAPCPQCGPHGGQQHTAPAPGPRYGPLTQEQMWRQEHAARLADKEKLPIYDRLLKDAHGADWHPKAREKERAAILMDSVKRDLFGDTPVINLNKDQTQKIVQMYNLRREYFGVRDITLDEKALLNRVQEARDVIIPRQRSQEPVYEKAEQPEDRLTVPGTRIFEYTHRIPTSVKTTGKSWTTRPHELKGNFSVEDLHIEPGEGRKTYLISGQKGNGWGTHVIVDEYSRAQGARNNHVIVTETDHDQYGNRWRTRVREYAQPRTAKNHIRNRYGVYL